MSSLRAAVALGLIACIPVPAASAAFPGRNGRLAVVVQQGEGARVVTVRADGTRVRKIAAGRLGALVERWASSDRCGGVSVVLPDDGGPHALRVMDVEDGSARRVRLRTRPVSWQPQSPAWTPAGRFVFGRQVIGEAAENRDRRGRRRGHERVLSLPVGVVLGHRPGGPERRGDRRRGVVPRGAAGDRAGGRWSPARPARLRPAVRAPAVYRAHAPRLVPGRDADRVRAAPAGRRTDDPCDRCAQRGDHGRAARDGPVLVAGRQGLGSVSPEGQDRTRAGGTSGRC